MFSEDKLFVRFTEDKNNIISNKMLWRKLQLKRFVSVNYCCKKKKKLKNITKRLNCLHI